MDQRIANLATRLHEFSDVEQLDDYLDLCTEQLQAAADARNLEDARTLGAAIEHTRREINRRRQEHRAREAEMKGLLATAGLADDAPEPEPAPEPAAVVASLRGVPTIGDLASVRRRTTRRTSSRSTEDRGIAEIAERLVAKRQSFGKGSASGRHHVGSIQRTYPLDRTLGPDADLNRERVEAWTDSLTASGGLCEPLEAHFEQFTINSAVRPIAGGLPAFKADRGGINFVRPPTLADLDSGVAITTEAQDQADQTKPIVTLTCPDEQSVLVHAASLRVQFGNWNRKFRGEYVGSWISAGLSQHARVAERQLLSQVDAASVAVTTAQSLGSTRDLLAAVDQASAYMRHRARMLDTQMLTAIFPSEAKPLIRADLARQHAGDNTYAVSDAMIQSWFAARSILPIWSLDSVDPPAQTAGPLINFVDTIVWRLFPSGAFLFLDGGSISIDLIMDSTLAATNDSETFFESFEAAAKVDSGQSFTVTSTICPSGEAAALLASDCTIGS